MNDHRLGISTGVHDITDLIKYELAHKLGMRTEVHSYHNEKRDNVKYGQHNDGHNLKLLQIQLSVLEVDINEKYVIDNQSIHHQGNDTETVRYLLCILCPHFPRKRPCNGRHYQKHIDNTNNNRRCTDILIFDIDLINRHVQNKPIDCGSKVTCNKRQ